MQANLETRRNSCSSANRWPKKVITVGQDDDIFAAREKLAANNIRHLPVVEDADRLVGIVTDRDVRSALPHKFFQAHRHGPRRWTPIGTSR